MSMYTLYSARFAFRVTNIAPTTRIANWSFVIIQSPIVVPILNFFKIEDSRIEDYFKTRNNVGDIKTKDAKLI